MGDFDTILHAQLEFSFHDIFNNTFRQGFAAGELILPIILRSLAHLSFSPWPCHSQCHGLWQSCLTG